jgi:tetratricopeptide (TPR) repeat protein
VVLSVITVLIGNRAAGFNRLENSELLDNGLITVNSTFRVLNFDHAKANLYQWGEEITIGVPYELNIGFNPVYEFSGQYDDGLSMIELYLNKEIFAEKFRSPGVNLKGFLRFGGANDVFTTTGEEDFGLLVHAHKKLDKDLNLALELGVTFRNDRPNYNIDSSFDYSLGLEHQWSRGLKLSGELYGNTSAYDTGISIISLGMGFDYRFTDILNLHGFIGAGLNERSPDWDASLTLALLFPARADNRALDVVSLENRIENYLRLGYKYGLEGDWTRAGEAYEKAVELDPVNTRALNNLGSAYLEIGRYREAVTVLKRAISLARSDPDLYYNLGLAHIKLDDLVNARLAWETALELNPGHEAALRNLRILKMGGIAR